MSQVKAAIPTKLHDSLARTLAAYPSTAKKRRRSRLIDRGEYIELAFTFNRTPYDRADELTVAFVAERVGVQSCTPSDGRPTTICYRCDLNQSKQFERYLKYASTLPMGSAPPRSEQDQTSLPGLLTHTLLAFTNEYESGASSSDIPSLEVLSNVLRIIPRSGLEQKTFERRAVITSRVARVVLRHCAELGWLTIDKPAQRGAPSRVTLTDEGLRIRQRGNRRQKRIETIWSKRYGKTLAQVQTCLDAITNTFELELPHSITGYGLGDESITGGPYLPAEKGPPYIPSRGTEWPVVFRVPNQPRKRLSLSAQLSQTLAQFALDYEAERLGMLGLTTLFLQHIPDEGLSLADARKHQPITGNGKSFFERHLYIALEPGKNSDGTRHVYPTQKTRRSRDAYPYLVAEIESRWEQSYGRSVMTTVRKSLEELDQSFDNEWLDYPNTTAWMAPWYRPFLLQGN